MKKKEIKSYIEQAIRKLPTDREVGGIKYYLKKAITLLDQPEEIKQETKIPVIKKPIPINEQYNFQPMTNTKNAKNVVANLDLMIEQEKKKLEDILNRKKKPKDDDETVEQIFG